MITKYDQGSIEWVTELIAKRAERMGSVGADLDDAVQEIVLPVMRSDTAQPAPTALRCARC